MGRGSALSSISYEIFPELGLVYVQYRGHALLDDTFAAFKRYMDDPGYRPGQKQLVDLSRVTSFEKDYVRLLSLQAKKAEAFTKGQETLVVYITPTESPLSLAELVSRSWEDVSNVVPIIVRTEEEALGVLGIEGVSVAGLRERKVS